MHIQRLEIHNFRAIEFVSVGDLPSTVVIAGPNGCGKSCIFDAIRLWKSVIGGYAENEWHQWFSEFQISLDLTDQVQLERLFRDRSKPVRITADISLSAEETKFLTDNASDLLRPLVTKGTPDIRNPKRTNIPSILTEPEAEKVRSRTEEKAALIVKELQERTSFSGTFTINTDLTLLRESGPTLELLYSLYLPESLGVFEYHSAQRTYQREQISNINLNLPSAEHQRSQQALYNWAAKYQNVKTQLASNYIRELLSDRAGATQAEKESLIGSMKELFRLFLPDKEFMGPQPTSRGALIFNVKTASGKEHDINDLSSGEKELLYGYLRLRNLAPRHSVLLLDEPEMHLNPRLIRGLPQFYHAHLGKQLSNQIWLLTHSDTLLKEALDQDGFALFHMLPATPQESGNQLVPINSAEGVERVVLDLVGEIASYKPDGKLVLFEGGGDTEFDTGMTADLFPELAQAANLVSATNKVRVRELHRVLEKARNKGALRLRVFSVVDKDSEPVGNTNASTELTWDCYHIENYLLEPRYILEALQDTLRTKCNLKDEGAVQAALHGAAADVAAIVARSELERWVNSILVQCITVGSDPDRAKLIQSIHESIQGIENRILGTTRTQLTAEALRTRLGQAEDRIREELADDRWKRQLPGREILKRFADKYSGGIGYEKLRNLVIASMKRAGHRPAGMAKVVQEILAG